jgi:hypothetical protein
VSGSRKRAAWTLWGVVAGAAGLASNLLTDDQAELLRGGRIGPETMQLLERSTYHLGAVSGMLAVGCLLVAAAGWRRWARRVDGEPLAALVIAPALTASAAALIVGYGLKGGLAEYLPGGINDDNFTAEGLFVLFMVNDTAPYLGWWGVLVAAAAFAWLALVERVLPLWLGAVSALAILAPTAILVASGATALAGTAAPIWLVVASVAAFAYRSLEPGERDEARRARSRAA